MVEIAIIDLDYEYSSQLRVSFDTLNIIDSYDISLYSCLQELIDDKKNFDIIIVSIGVKTEVLDYFKFLENSILIYLYNDITIIKKHVYINAFAYVHKKEVVQTLGIILNKAINYIYSRSLIMVKTDIGYKYLHYMDIIYITYNQRNIYIYTKQKEYSTVFKSLEYVEKSLPNIFIKINRNTIINSLYINIFKNNGELRMKYCNNLMKVSRRKKEIVLETMMMQSKNL